MQTNLDLFSLPASGLTQNTKTNRQGETAEAASSFAGWLSAAEVDFKQKKPGPMLALEPLEAAQTLAQSGFLAPTQLTDEEVPLDLDLEADEGGETAHLDLQASGQDEGQELDSDLLPQTLTSTATADPSAQALAAQGTQAALPATAQSEPEKLVTAPKLAPLAASTIATAVAPNNRIAAPSTAADQSIVTTGSTGSSAAPTMSIHTESSGEVAPQASLSGYVVAPVAEAPVMNGPVPGAAPTEPAMAATMAAPDAVSPSVAGEDLAMDAVSDQTQAPALKTKTTTSQVAVAQAGPTDSKPGAQAGAEKILQSTAAAGSTLETLDAPADRDFGGENPSSMGHETTAATRATDAPLSLNEVLDDGAFDSGLEAAVESAVDDGPVAPRLFDGRSLASTEAFKSDLFVTHAQAPQTTAAPQDSALAGSIPLVDRVDPVASTAATSAAASLRSMTPATPQFESIAEQLRLHMSPGVSRVSFIVDPPELGRVLVRLSMQRGRLIGEISAENRDVAKTLDAGLASLKHNLQESGVNVDSLRVHQDPFLDGGDGQAMNERRSHHSSGDRERSEGRTDRQDLRGESARSKSDPGRTSTTDGQVNLMA